MKSISVSHQTCWSDWNPFVQHGFQNVGYYASLKLGEEDSGEELLKTQINNRYSY